MPLPRATYLLLLLDADNGAPIRGRTRLEKLAFIIQMKVIEGLHLGITNESYEFRPFNYGPYTEEVLDDIVSLQMVGLVQIDGEPDSEQTFRITREGQTAVERLLTDKRIPPILVEEIRRVKTVYGRLSLDKLIGLVYREWPEFTEKSEIKGRYF
jgi:uncharacterized protein YwgA